MTHGESSVDQLRQQKCVATVIKNAQRNNGPSIPSSVAPAASIKSDPIIFIADTDSVSFCMDTGANRTMTNDAKLINDPLAMLRALVVPQPH